MALRLQAPKPERKPESTASARRRFNADFAIHPLYEFLGDRCTKAGASVTPPSIFVSLGKGVEDPRGGILAHADSGVRDVPCQDHAVLRHEVG